MFSTSHCQRCVRSYIQLYDASCLHALDFCNTHCYILVLACNDTFPCIIDYVCCLLPIFTVISIALQITLALLNARMSRVSYQNWSLPVILPLTSLLLSKFSLIVPLVSLYTWYILYSGISFCVLLLLILLFFITVIEHYTRNTFSAAAGFTIYH